MREGGKVLRNVFKDQPKLAKQAATTSGWVNMPLRAVGMSIQRQPASLPGPHMACEDGAKVCKVV